MATIFKHPALTDYFHDMGEVRIDTPPAQIPSLLVDYEAANVFSFSELKLDIDFDFWARLPADKYPGFKKMMCYVHETMQAEFVDRALRKVNAPPELLEPLARNITSLFRQIMPIYYALFRGYDYSIERAVFRLNTTMNENLHFDTYKEEYPEHLARMFINLDDQPRIWHTSYTVEEIFHKFGHKLSREVLQKTTANRLWRELNIAAFGKGLQEWYDGEPRHVVYFAPGDVWVVDSRQVAHQIYYGRRAISIDFVVKLDSMLDRNKHYLAMSERYRGELLKAPAPV